MQRELARRKIAWQPDLAPDADDTGRLTTRKRHRSPTPSAGRSSGRRCHHGPLPPAPQQAPAAPPARRSPPAPPRSRAGPPPARGGNRPAAAPRTRLRRRRRVRHLGAAQPPGNRGRPRGRPAGRGDRPGHRARAGEAARPGPLARDLDCRFGSRRLTTTSSPSMTMAATCGSRSSQRQAVTASSAGPPPSSSSQSAPAGATSCTGYTRPTPRRRPIAPSAIRSAHSTPENSGLISTASRETSGQWARLPARGQRPKLRRTPKMSPGMTSGPHRNRPMNSTERLVPVPRMSAAGFAVFSEIRTSGQPPLALRDAVRAGRVPVLDLPEIIANIWTWDDSPTSDLGEADWLEIYRAAGFFSYPPLLVRQPDGTPPSAASASQLGGDALPGKPGEPDAPDVMDVRTRSGGATRKAAHALWRGDPVPGDRRAGANTRLLGASQRGMDSRGQTLRDSQTSSAWPT